MVERERRVGKVRGEAVRGGDKERGQERAGKLKEIGRRGGGVVEKRK